MAEHLDQDERTGTIIQKMLDFYTKPVKMETNRSSALDDESHFDYEQDREGITFRRATLLLVALFFLLLAFAIAFATYGPQVTK